MLFTDGLYEVQGANSEFYTQALLTQAVQQHAQEPASEILRGLSGLPDEETYSTQ